MFSTAIENLHLNPYGFHSDINSEIGRKDMR
jgi:hypothetical protein